MEDFKFKEEVIGNPALIAEKVTNKPQDKKVVIIYNPYLRQILVYFVDYQYSVVHQFSDSSEWVWVDHPCITDQYLAIELDYDETAQLIIYYEERDQDDIKLSDCDSWHSGGGQKSSNIIIVETDNEWDIQRAVLPLLDSIQLPILSIITFKNKEDE